jgi:hypothetical protein
MSNEHKARGAHASRRSARRRAATPVAAAFALSLAASTQALACACGCAVFDVGTSSLLPSGPGGTAFLEYDFLDQNTNWSGTSRAPAADNDDKEIRSNFLLAGTQYMFDSSWGVMAEVPYTDRYFRTQEASGDIASFDHGALGDIRLMGVYSGFSPDMSTGVIFGVKLPTGDHTYPNFDADTEIGSGSTDVLLGGYHSGSLTTDQSFGYFAQVLYQHEVAIQYGYRPGPELNGALGVSYNNFMLGSVHVAPVFQMLVSNRGRDGGPQSDPPNTGYTRLIASPGLEVDTDEWKFYADVEVPVYQDMNGNQLIAPAALKFIVSHSF